MSGLLAACVYASAMLLAVSPHGEEAAQHLSGTLQIATDGSVRDIELDGEVDHQLYVRVERRISEWRFETVDPTRANRIRRVRMYLTLRPMDIDGVSRFHVVQAVFGEMLTPSRFNAPIYPRQAVSDGVEASIDLLLRVGANGRVLDAHAYRVDLWMDQGSRRVPQTEKLIAGFRQSALTTGRNMRFAENSGIESRIISFTIVLRLPQGRQAPMNIPGESSLPPWVDDSASHIRTVEPVIGVSI